jgi:hypothetical protein
MKSVANNQLLATMSGVNSSSGYMVAHRSLQCTIIDISRKEQSAQQETVGAVKQMEPNCVSGLVLVRDRAWFIFTFLLLSCGSEQTAYHHSLR